MEYKTNKQAEYGVHAEYRGACRIQKCMQNTKLHERACWIQECRWNMRYKRARPGISNSIPTHNVKTAYTV